MRNHYRGHKMSLWLNLIPQLHRPGEPGDDISMRHHHFQEEGDQYYDGFVRAQTDKQPSFIHVLAPPMLTTRSTVTSSTTPTPAPPKSDTAVQATTTECPPNVTLVVPSISKTNHNNLLRKLASNQYQSYTTALTVTIAVGCFLLLLNILIFAGIYHQRDRGKKEKRKQEEQAETGCCSSSSPEMYGKAFEQRHSASYDCTKNPYQLSRGNSFERKSLHNYIGEFSCDKRTLTDVQMTELPLQQFNSSPVKRPPEVVTSTQSTSCQPPDVTTVTNSCVASQTTDSDEQTNSDEMTSPPMKTATVCNQTGILRPHGAPTTPGTMKKRVQIQEISV
ncbi:hypothetical protein WA026_006569 [Henosepilachna vigintioctopunctata]|uniref:Neuroligin n=1 Tax=Henosepilachna vigintioctopunctata TaxID=420089 RepID=A0AAW1UG37_9CUCU